MQQLCLIFCVLVNPAFRGKHPAGCFNYASPLCHGPQTGRPLCSPDFCCVGAVAVDDCVFRSDRLPGDSFRGVITVSRPLYDKLILKARWAIISEQYDNRHCVYVKEMREHDSSINASVNRTRPRGYVSEIEAPYQPLWPVSCPQA